MSRGKFKKKTKGRSALFLLLLLLLLLSLSVGGVAAYLSMTSNVAQNTFTAANQPSVTVTDTTVTVSPNDGYGVYLRLAVDVYWKHRTEANLILAEEPASGFALGGTGWKEIDGFYYYTSVITETTTLNLPVVIDSCTNGDYQLAAKVAAQVVQAVGTVDGGTKTAVEDAWGVTPQQITG